MPKVHIAFNPPFIYWVLLQDKCTHTNHTLPLLATLHHKKQQQQRNITFDTHKKCTRIQWTVREVGESSTICVGGECNLISDFLAFNADLFIQPAATHMKTHKSNCVKCSCIRTIHGWSQSRDKDIRILQQEFQ